MSLIAQVQFLQELLQNRLRLISQATYFYDHIAVIFSEITQSGAVLLGRSARQVK
jgi:hypothetical protein